DRAGRGMAAVVRTGVGRRERRAVRIGTIARAQRRHQLLSRAHDRAIAGAGRGLVAEDAVAGFLGVGLDQALWLAVGTVGLAERAVVDPAVVAHLDTDTDRIHLAGAHVGVRARVVGNGRDAATRLVPVTWPAHKVVGTDGPGARPDEPELVVDTRDTRAHRIERSGHRTLDQRGVGAIEGNSAERVVVVVV